MKEMVSDSFQGWFNFCPTRFQSYFHYFAWISHLDLSILYFTASCIGCHARSRRRLLNPQDLALANSTLTLLKFSTFY